MANRHKVQEKAKGGRVYYQGGSSNVAKEAAEKKRGGKVHGKKASHRVDKRARGGGVGSDKSPFSSAHIKGSHGAASNPAAHATGGAVGK